MRRRLCSLFLVVLFCAVTSLGAHAEILKIVINDTIHPITDEYIGRVLAEARAVKADAVLIEIRTPGGMVDSTRSIVEKILASDIPVIVFVAPTGGYAASAGFFILQSADVAAMAPGTNTGAAHPVIMGEKMDDVMKSKLENDAAAFMRSYVSRRGRNVEAAESAVRESKSFSEQEALDKNLIDVIAKDQAELLQKLDGRTVTRFNGSTLTLQIKGKPVRDFPMTVKESVLAFLMNPNIAFLLFSLGMLALYGEFNNPGAVLPGVVGVVCILLAVFALNILPTRFAGLAMILGAFALFALEVKYTSHGVLGIGGTILMVLGALMLVDGPIPEMRVSLFTALAVSIPFALITIFLMSLAVKAHMNKSMIGTESMVGMMVRAHTALTPRGTVDIEGEYWQANCAGHASAGEALVVKQVKGLELEVERAENQTPQS
ncbi:MAG: nodulation protein NfeD [Acidobacteriales bacterium]|nr:nodulation protein NfeD [Terriglobales bacterium]